MDSGIQRREYVPRRFDGLAGYMLGTVYMYQTLDNILHRARVYCCNGKRSHAVLSASFLTTYSVVEGVMDMCVYMEVNTQYCTSQA